MSDGFIHPVVHPTAGRGQDATEHRTLEELAAMNDPLNPASGQREVLERDNRQVLPDFGSACSHCRYMNGHSPICPTRFQNE